jgi:phospholipid/cholesterol/gamma-HCH transport system substrate-binding protein
LDNGTASIADLLGRARQPLAGTVDQLSRLAPLLDKDKNLIDVSLHKLPNNYRKLTRLGAYGAWFPYYLCGLALRVSDLQYRTVEVGITHQVTGRCAEPDA